MNFKNLAENLIIVIFSALVGGFIGYAASTQANKQSIELLTPTIVEAIKKETTSIKNEITHDIKISNNKFKKNDSLNIIITQKPNTVQKPVNQIQQKEIAGCAKDEVCIKIVNLTRRQRKRLGK